MNEEELLRDVYDLVYGMEIALGGFILMFITWMFVGLWLG